MAFRPGVTDNVGRTSREALSLLMAHDFPGNIRELENIIEYASVVCKDNRVGVEHLPDTLRPGSDDTTAGSRKAQTLSWVDLERSYISEALKQNRWNRAATARHMGIHPTTLWRKMKRLGLEVSRPVR